jgi:TetR/AcrR family transcriptional regulator
VFDTHQRRKKWLLATAITVDKRSQLLAFCEGLLSRFVRSEFRYRPTVDFDVRWPLLAAQLV